MVIRNHRRKQQKNTPLNKRTKNPSSYTNRYLLQHNNEITIMGCVSGKHRKKRLLFRQAKSRATEEAGENRGLCKIQYWNVHGT